MKRLNALLVLLVLAIAAFGQEDIKELQQKAEHGDNTAQYTLATYYRYGSHGAPKDYELAAFWYQRAATRSNGSHDADAYSKSRCLFGLCYYEGTARIKQDYAKAVLFFKESNEQVAYDKLGDCYYYGRGVDKDFKQAVSYYQLGAEGTWGNADALRGLARCHYYGHGVEQNYLEAVRLWERADDAESTYNIGKCYELGLGVEKNQPAATTWYAKSAAKGNVVAMYLLGSRYAHGEKVDEDAARAARYFEQLLAVPDSASTEAASYKLFAKFELAAIYGYGRGVPKDIARAMVLLLKDNAMPDEGLLLLGDIFYQDGTEGTPDSYAKSIGYLEKARAGANKQAAAAAAFILSKCYRFGRGVPADVRRADELLAEARAGGWEDDFPVSRFIPVLRIGIEP